MLTADGNPEMDADPGSRRSCMQHTAGAEAAI